MSESAEELPEARIARLQELNSLARDALIDAVHALNKARRFRVTTPGGCNDSYEVAAKIDQALIELGGDFSHLPWLRNRQV